MGFVDRMDQNVAKYRIGIRTKKWWWDLFAWMVNVALQNTWILDQVSKEDSDRSLFTFGFSQASSKYWGILAKGTLVILQSKTYHPISNLTILDTIRYPRRGKVDVMSVKGIRGIVVLSARLIYLTNVLKLSIGIRQFQIY